MNKIETRRVIRQLVQKTGSYAKLAEKLSHYTASIYSQKEMPLTRQAVHNWYTKGSMPHKWRHAIPYIESEQTDKLRG